MNGTNVTYRVHALQRMYERRISVDEGSINNRALHVVVAYNEKDNETIVITAYEPDPEKWEENFRRRKQ